MLLSTYEPLCSSILPHHVLQVVKEEYERKGAEDGPKVIMTITGEEVAVDIGDDGVPLPNGWSLVPLATPKVLHQSTWLLYHFNFPTFHFSSLSYHVPLWIAMSKEKKSHPSSLKWIGQETTNHHQNCHTELTSLEWKHPSVTSDSLES